MGKCLDIPAMDYGTNIYERHQYTHNWKWLRTEEITSSPTGCRQSYLRKLIQSPRDSLCLVHPERTSVNFCVPDPFFVTQRETARGEQTFKNKCILLDGRTDTNEMRLSYFRCLESVSKVDGVFTKDLAYPSSGANLRNCTDSPPYHHSFSSLARWSCRKILLQWRATGALY